MGWKDKQEIDNTSSDGSMTPKTGLEHLSLEELKELKYGNKG